MVTCYTLKTPVIFVLILIAALLSDTDIVASLDKEWSKYY